MSELQVGKQVTFSIPNDPRTLTGEIIRIEQANPLFQLFLDADWLYIVRVPGERSFPEVADVEELPQELLDMGMVPLTAEDFIVLEKDVVQAVMPEATA